MDRSLLDPERKAYSVKEVARILGMSRSGVHKMIKLGLLKAFPVGTKQLRVSAKSLEELMNSGFRDGGNGDADAKQDSA